MNNQYISNIQKALTVASPTAETLAVAQTAIAELGAAAQTAQAAAAEAQAMLDLLETPTDPISWITDYIEKMLTKQLESVAKAAAELAELQQQIADLSAFVESKVESIEAAIAETAETAIAEAGLEAAAAEAEAALTDETNVAVRVANEEAANIKASIKNAISTSLNN